MKASLKLLFIISIVVFSCKNGKKAVSTEDKKDQKVEQRAEEAIEKADVVEEKNEQQMPDPETKMFLNRAKAKLTDSLVARIERTACFGRCPIYIASIYKSGFVTYQGEKWVEKEGFFKSKMEQDNIDMLLKKATEVNFFSMKDAYDSPYVTDLPSTIITLRKADEVKIVANRYQGPEELAALELYFDELLNKLTYEPFVQD